MIAVSVTVELAEGTLSRLEAMIARLTGVAIAGDGRGREQLTGVGEADGLAGNAREVGGAWAATAERPPCGEPTASPPAASKGNRAGLYRASASRPPVLAGQADVKERGATAMPVENASTEPGSALPMPAGGAPVPLGIALTSARLPGSPWTDERRTLLRELWPVWVPPREIAERLAKLPGWPAPEAGSINAYARYMKLQRAARPLAPADLEPLAEPDAEASSPQPAQPEPPVGRNQASAAPERVTYATAFAWAGQRGLAHVRNGMDLGRVNLKRAELGLPAFELSGRAA